MSDGIAPNQQVKLQNQKLFETCEHEFKCLVKELGGYKSHHKSENYPYAYVRFDSSEAAGRFYHTYKEKQWFGFDVKPYKYQSRDVTYPVPIDVIISELSQSFPEKSKISSGTNIDTTKATLIQHYENDLSYIQDEVLEQQQKLVIKMKELAGLQKYVQELETNIKKLQERKKETGQNIVALYGLK
ncbi:hypothetical protein INT45_004594 [Circinella minor]|uniref:Uncharacterized protein n=1 Tax=Circinella minor TaxID=1195481 RepID=A0A8H7VLQ4_9FUNG|nr:hypothetical protein INT45_004594 [Circinella minor]